MEALIGYVYYNAKGKSRLENLETRQGETGTKSWNFFETTRQNIKTNQDSKRLFETRQDFWVFWNLGSRQDKTFKWFKISRRDGTRQHFPSRLGREFGTGNFPTHHWYSVIFKIIDWLLWRKLTILPPLLMCFHLEKLHGSPEE